MIANEGLCSYGVDLSPEAIRLAGKLSLKHRTKENFTVKNIVDLEFLDTIHRRRHQCFWFFLLERMEFLKFMDEVSCVLKPGRPIFNFSSKRLDGFSFFRPRRMLNSSTLDGFSRSDAPYTGNLYDLGFVGLREFAARPAGKGFSISYLRNRLKNSWK